MDVCGRRFGARGIPVDVLWCWVVVLEPLRSLASRRSVHTLRVHETLSGEAFCDDLADVDWLLASAAYGCESSFDVTCWISVRVMVY